MRIVLAPDGFKDACSATAACDAMALGVRRAAPDADIIRCPVADGGEGFVQAMLGLPGAQRQTRTVTGPLNEPVEATWALLDRGRVGVVELAQAAGLERVPPSRRDPTRTTTFGVGELIRAALNAGAATVLLGVGGSATNDAGCGMAQALGARFYQSNHQPLDAPLTGGGLARVRHIDLAGVDPRLAPGTLRVACDVTNPLHGPHGAAHVYAKQKGATPQQSESLDAGLKHIAAAWQRPGVPAPQTPGLGAAGGTAGGAVCMLNAVLQRGAELVLDAVAFDEKIRHADLVITGEGRLDAQSLSGKAVLAVARRAAACDVPTVALVGSATDDAGHALRAGLHAFEVLAPSLPPAESIARTAELLADAAERITRRFAV